MCLRTCLSIQNEIHHNCFVLWTTDRKVLEGLKKRLFGYLLVSQCLNERLIKNRISFFFRNFCFGMESCNSHSFQLKSYMYDIHAIKNISNGKLIPTCNWTLCAVSYYYLDSSRAMGEQNQDRRFQNSKRFRCCT